MIAALLQQHTSRLSSLLPLMLRPAACAPIAPGAPLSIVSRLVTAYSTSIPCSGALSANSTCNNPNLEYSDLNTEASGSSSSTTTTTATSSSTGGTSGSSSSTSSKSGGSSVPGLDPVMLERFTAQQQQVLQQLLRDCLTAEAAVTQLLRGQQLLLRNRPDAAAFADQEQQQVEAVRQVMARYRARPSMLLSAARLAGFGLGAAATAAPPPIRAAVLGAVQDALTEQYNEHLRALREAGLSEEVPEVRSLLLSLRNMQRAPEGAPDPPDLVALQQMQNIQDIGAVGAVGALVKAAMVGALDVVSKVRL